MQQLFGQILRPRKGWSQLNLGTQESSLCIEAFKIAAQYAVSSSNKKNESKKTGDEFPLVGVHGFPAHDGTTQCFATLDSR